MMLDNLEKISELDSENMFQMVYDWPELIDRVLKYSFKLPISSKINQYKISYEGSISQIVIVGMGGSAIIGDYLQTYLEKTSKIPIIIQRNYDIPAFIGKDTVVIFISYSGNTEETISCLISAIKKSARIIGIGSGGRLEDFFNKYDLPFFPVLSGYQPRASFPLLFFPLLKVLNELGIYSFDQQALEETIAVFKEMREELNPKVLTEKNRAKQIAQSIFGRIPVIWSPFGCVSERLKCQVNENSKVLAISTELPEFNHNHIVGWENWANNNPFIILVFRFPIEHPNVSLRFEITKEILSTKAKIVELTARGSSLLCQLFSSTYFGDYISMYLAILNNQNPSSVKSIDFLKKQLEERANTQSEIFSSLFKLSG